MKKEYKQIIAIIVLLTAITLIGIGPFAIAIMYETYTIKQIVNTLLLIDLLFIVLVGIVYGVHKVMQWAELDSGNW